MIPFAVFFWSAASFQKKRRACLEADELAGEWSRNEKARAMIPCPALACFRGGVGVGWFVWLRALGSPPAGLRQGNEDDLSHPRAKGH